MNRWIVAAFSLTVGAGCASHARVGAFGADAFYSARDHYRIGYVAQRPHLISPEWSIDNFQSGPDGVGPVKWTRDYTRTVSLDRNDDGRDDQTLVIESYDLRLMHRRDGTVMWAQTTPVATRVADRELSVVAHDFVDRVGGGSYVEIDWNAEVARERRFGTVIRAEGPVSVDGVAAHQITFDLVSLDQREVDAAHQGDRITIAIARPAARWEQPSRPYVAGQTEGFSMLVMFGYASRAEHHDAHRQEFEQLLEHIDFHETP